MKKNALTPMQRFALDILSERADTGTCGAYVGNRWRQEKTGRVSSPSSRDTFGSTSAGYRALRSLVKLGMARVERTKTRGGYSIETYFIA